MTNLDQASIMEVLISKFIKNIMDSATVFAITLCTVVIAFTGYAIYIAFGPPSKELADPFEEHED